MNKAALLKRYREVDDLMKRTEADSKMHEAILKTNAYIIGSARLELTTIELQVSEMILKEAFA